MKTWRIIPGIFLAVIMIMALAPAARGALLNREYQAFQLGGSSDTTGILSFTKLNVLMPDGTQVAIGTLPPTAPAKLVITFININFHAVNSSLNTNVDICMGPFYSRTVWLSNGSGGYTDAFDPGIVISPSGFNNPSYNNFYAINQNGDIIPGTVNVRLLGYVVFTP